MFILLYFSPRFCLFCPFAVCLVPEQRQILRGIMAKLAIIPRNGMRKRGFDAVVTTIIAQRKEKGNKNQSVRSCGSKRQYPHKRVEILPVLQ